MSGSGRPAFPDAARQALADFSLVAGLDGRRSRRFSLGAEIPDRPLAYRSARDPRRAYGALARERSGRLSSCGRLRSPRLTEEWPAALSRRSASPLDDGDGS